MATANAVSFQSACKQWRSRRKLSQLSLFSMISTIGTPQDVTTDELRIEAFYPTDSATELFFRSMV